MLQKAHTSYDDHGGTMSKSKELISENSTFILKASNENQGERIDKFVTHHFADYSRSFLKKLFSQKQIILNQSKAAKPGNTLKSGDTVSISFPSEQTKRKQKDVSNDIKINIIAKEKDFLIIDKPAGLVVHPPNETFEEAALTDWIKQNYSEIAHVGMIDRPGIVHRLDRDTSGLMIIARTNAAHAAFTKMFKNREINKTYLAIVSGHPEKTGSIDYFIGRHPVVRHKMTHFTPITKLASSRHATTHFSTIQYFESHSLVEAKPITGRTHQIRVHLAALGHPLLADQLYGTSSKLLKRHALHAHKLEFQLNNKQYSFTSPLAQDLENFIAQNS